jgi:hypothetical protein
MFHFRSAIAVVVLFSPGVMSAAEHHHRVQESPGFWERAFKSSRKATVGAAELVAHPFSGSEKKAQAADKAWNQLEMTMVVEPAVVKLPATRSLSVKVSLLSKGKKLVQLDFPNSRRIDLVLKGEGGAVLSRFSDDQKVEDEAALVSINPGERLEYNATISTREMKPGVSYVLEAFFPAYESLRTSKTIVPEK